MNDPIEGEARPLDVPSYRDDQSRSNKLIINLPYSQLYTDAYSIESSLTRRHITPVMTSHANNDVI